jgi:hypothetical protein
MDDSLLIHWPYLGLALLMLWFPRQWMRFGRLLRKKRKQREMFEKFAQQGGKDPDDKSVQLTREFGKKRNYLDLLRGIVGGYALWHFSFDAGTPAMENTVVGIATVVSMVGLLIQSVRRDDGRLAFFAPIFFCAGLSLTMDLPYVGGFAFLLTCAINPMLPTPRMFLTCYGLLLLPFGFLFGESFLVVVANTFLLLLLPLLSLMAGRSLVIFSKKAD